MQNRIDIDRTHTRAIANEIGERLRLHLGGERRMPANLKKQIARLRELDEQSPSIVPEQSFHGRR